MDVLVKILEESDVCVCLYIYIHWQVTIVNSNYFF